VTELVKSIALTINDDDNLLIGELTRHTVMQISKKEINQLVGNQCSIVNLQQVTRIDTAGLAWLFYLLEQASHNNCQLTFSNIPVKLHKLISLSGVEGFLPIHT